MSNSPFICAEAKAQNIFWNQKKLLLTMIPQFITMLYGSWLHSYQEEDLLPTWNCTGGEMMISKNQGLGSSDSYGQPNFWRRMRQVKVHTFNQVSWTLELTWAAIHTHPCKHAMLLLRYVCFIVISLSSVSLELRLISASYLTNKADLVLLLRPWEKKMSILKEMQEVPYTIYRVFSSLIL